MFNADMMSDRTANREETLRRKAGAVGVDPAALRHQVEENGDKVESEKSSFNTFAADMVRNDKVACLLGSRKLKEERILQQTLDDYRHRFQQPQHRRERDLQAPGAAGLQVTLPGLLGEDPGRGARLQRQKEQLREWSRQQQQELEAARRQQTVADEHYNQSRINVDSKTVQLHEVEQATKKALAHATKDYNLAMAAENRERRRRAREKNEDDKHQADVLNHLQADRELEASQNTALQAVRQRINCNLDQVEEKRRTQWEKQLEEEQQERLRLGSVRSAVLLERQQSQTNRMQRQELDHTNAQLAQAQRQQKKALEKEFVGGFEDSFFAKFNTGRR
ncbi:RIB43A-like with coiled-coils protein 2 [Merluccius polli]|uniref:RIB43A-like with coiled-coils protein 2 n=1 Tax=Merluccius polli TaxID=89951 RepID=A0AA47NBQ9_MERPO|nr:RIB43A-like with coiled-coils protein 2 [Merluccius polli]